MADMNVNQSNIEKIAQYLQTNSGSTKEVSSNDVETIFNSMSGNGAEAVETQKFATTFAEEFLEKEMDEIEDDYLIAWEALAASDGDGKKISADDVKVVKELLDEYKEGKLPEGWSVENGVIKDADGNVVEAVDPKDLPKDATITDDGKIVDASGKQIGTVAKTQVEDSETGVKKDVESYYLIKQEETQRNEKAVSSDELPEGHQITDDGKILDKDGNEIGRTEVTYGDATSDGVNDKITSYFLYEDSNLPEGWTTDENGVIKDENGRELTAVDAQTIDEGNYDVKDGVIYNEFGQEVGRVVSQETDAVGEDGVKETVDSYYLYNDVPEIKEVQVNPDELPEDYTINDEGKILDKDGNVWGCVKESYLDAANSDGVNDKVTQFFKYEEVTEDSNLPDGWSKNDDGTITDENGQKLTAVDAETIDNGDYDVKEGKIFDKDGNEVGRVVSQESDAVGEDGVKETVDSYYLYVPEEPATVAEPEEPATVAEPEEPASPSVPADEELPTVGAGTEEEKPSVLTDEAAAKFAEQLFETMDGVGTDEQQFKNILNNEELSSDDWVKIMSVYSEQYGSLIQHVDGDFSGKEQDEIMAQISAKLLESAEGGNEQAVEILCKELYNGTAGMWGTADEFVAGVLDNASDEVLAQIMTMYSEVNQGADIYADIKADFSGKTEDKYLDRLNDILAKMRE